MKENILRHRPRIVGKIFAPIIHRKPKRKELIQTVWVRKHNKRLELWFSKKLTDQDLRSVKIQTAECAKYIQENENPTSVLTITFRGKISKIKECKSSN